MVDIRYMNAPDYFVQMVSEKFKIFMRVTLDLIKAYLSSEVSGLSLVSPTIVRSMAPFVPGTLKTPKSWGINWTPAFCTAKYALSSASNIQWAWKIFNTSPALREMPTSVTSRISQESNRRYKVLLLWDCKHKFDTRSELGNMPPDVALVWYLLQLPSH